MENKIKNDLQRDNINGHVRSIELYSFDIKTTFWKTQKGSLDCKMVYRYNDTGHLIEMSWYDSDGNLNIQTNYKYDKQGDLVEKIILQGNIIIKMVNKYDKEGNKIEVMEVPPMKSLTVKSTYKYDNMGNVAEEKRFDSDDYLNGITTNIYDKNCNLIEKNTYFGDGSFKEKIVFSYNDYDKFGNWLRQNIYRHDKLSGIGERKIDYY